MRNGSGSLAGVIAILWLYFLAPRNGQVQLRNLRHHAQMGAALAAFAVGAGGVGIAAGTAIDVAAVAAGALVRILALLCAKQKCLLVPESLPGNDFENDC